MGGPIRSRATPTNRRGVPWRQPARRLTPTAGGTAASSTRSTPAPTPTPTATASATCPASSPSSTTSPASASTACGCPRSRCSPNRDWGYDVSDYRDIDPAFGTLDDLDTLVREAGARGIRILMDLVPNHTSDQHAWFVDALRGRDAAHRDYYVWADPKPDGSPPNNWVSIFGGPAWQLRRGQRAVLPAQLRGRAAGPQLVERRRAARVRRHRALLVGPRRGRVPHRRLQHDDQGQGAARQPAGDRGRPARPAVHGRALRLQHRPARGARHPAPLARHRRHLRARAPPHRRDQRGEAAGASWSSTATGATSCTAASTSCSSMRRFEADALRAVVEEHRGAAARGRLAHLDGVEPRRLAPRHPLGRRRPGQGEAGAAAPADPARARPSSMPATRSAWSTATCARGRARPVGARFWPSTRGATPSARRCPGTASPVAGFTAAGVRTVAAHGRPGRLQRGRPGGRPRLGARALPARHRGAPGQRGPGRRLVPLAPVADGTWAYARGGRHRRCCSTWRTTRPPSRA